MMFRYARLALPGKKGEAMLKLMYDIANALLVDSSPTNVRRAVISERVRELCTGNLRLRPMGIVCETCSGGNMALEEAKMDGKNEGCGGKDLGREVG